MKYKLVIVFTVVTCCVSCLETRRPERRANLTISAPEVDSVAQIEEKIFSLFGNELAPRSKNAAQMRRTRSLIAAQKKAYET
ncbi:MAG: hypothetical protein AAFO69_14100, partial [Bacteroidota bacterium]